MDVSSFKDTEEATSEFRQQAVNILRRFVVTSQLRF